MRTEWNSVRGESEPGVGQRDGAFLGRSGVGLIAASAAAVVGAAGLAHFDLPRGAAWRADAQRDDGMGDPKDRASGTFRCAEVFADLPMILTQGDVIASEGAGEDLPAVWPEGLTEEQRAEINSQREKIARFLSTGSEPEGVPPRELTAGEVITELLTSATGRYSSSEIPALVESIVTISRTAAIEDETLAKIDHILQSAHRHPEGDELCVEVIRGLGANTMLFRVAALHDDRTVADAALLALAEEHPAVASWLATERGESVKNLLRNVLNKESNVPLYDMIEQMIAQHDADTEQLNGARERIAILDGLIEQQKDLLAKANERQVEQEAQIARLERSLADEKAALARAEEVQREQNRKLEELRKKFEEEKRRNFVFIDDRSYRIIRQLTGGVEVASNSRNYNFRLPANAGETVLCVVTDSDLTDAQKREMPMRLKRDKKNAKDKDVRKPLLHGDLWIAEPYVKNGERFYVKHENGRTLHVAFYVVVEEAFTL